jgi:hypothetical protein
MDLGIIFIAICAFCGQLWAFRCYQELQKLRVEFENMRRSGEKASR